MFRTNNIYIQINRTEITVINLDTGIIATHTVTEPFSTQRSVLSSFSPAHETLLAAFLRDLGIKTTFFKAKAVIQQMEDTEGGLTNIEKRALRDLAKNAGAGKVYILDGQRRLSNSEALVYMKDHRP